MATPTQEKDAISPPGPRRGGRRLMALGAVIAVILAAGLFWYFNRTVPEEVSLEDAVAAVTDDTTVDGDTETLPPTTTTPATTQAPATTEAPPATDAPPASEGGGSAAVSLDGTWQVDTSIGEFNFEAATSSFAGFRVEEELSSIGSATAVGRTPNVSGTLELEGSDILSVIVEADLTGIVTNDSRRDSRVQSALNTSEFPVATFTLTEPIALGSVPAEGEPVTVTAIGELTINGITQPVEFPLEAQLTSGLIVVVGALNITFADFDVTVPSAPIVLSAEDNGILEIQLFFAM